MVQAVVLPGILISNGTPDRQTGRRQSVYINAAFFEEQTGRSLPTSSAAWRVRHQEVCEYH